MEGGVGVGELAAQGIPWGSFQAPRVPGHSVWGACFPSQAQKGCLFCLRKDGTEPPGEDAGCLLPPETPQQWLTILGEGSSNAERHTLNFLNWTFVVLNGACWPASPKRRCHNPEVRASGCVMLLWPVFPGNVCVHTLSLSLSHPPICHPEKV